MKKFLFIVLFLYSINSFSQGVVIGGDTADASAILELRSTSKGLLLPRLTQSQRMSIISPPAGLQIYNSTSNSVEYYNGTTWQNLTQGLWVPDATGMYYNSGKVSIGTPSSNFFLGSSAIFTVNGTSDFVSGDTWQTAMRFRNTSVNWEYDFIMAGSGNTAYPPRSIALYHASANGGGSGSRFIWNTDGTSNGYFAIGSYTGNASVPKSRLHVFNGDVNVEDIGRGIIMKSPDGQCWRVTVANNGSLVTTSITCP